MDVFYFDLFHKLKSYPSPNSKIDAKKINPLTCACGVYHQWTHLRGQSVLKCYTVTRLTRTGHIGFEVSILQPECDGALISK